MRNNTLLKITIGILAVLGIALATSIVGFRELNRLSEREANFAGRSIENGAKLFETNCIGCHGVQGQGIPGVAPALNSANFFDGRLQEVGYAGTLQSSIKLTIASGRPVGSGNYSAVMPTWGEEYGGPLRPDQVRDLADFILNWEATAVGGGEATPTEEVVIDPNADPVETVTVSAFWMDRHEVTNADYAECVAAGPCTAPFPYRAFRAATCCCSCSCSSSPPWSLRWHGRFSPSPPSSAAASSPSRR